MYQPGYEYTYSVLVLNAESQASVLQYFIWNGTMARMLPGLWRVQTIAGILCCVVLGRTASPSFAVAGPTTRTAASDSRPLLALHTPDRSGWVAVLPPAPAAGAACQFTHVFSPYGAVDPDELFHYRVAERSWQEARRAATAAGIEVDYVAVALKHEELSVPGAPPPPPPLTPTHDGTPS